MKYFGRLAVLIVFILPWAALLVLPSIKNIWTNMIVKKAGGAFGMAFTITAFYDWVCAKLKLYDTSAVGVLNKAVEMVEKAFK